MKTPKFRSVSERTFRGGSRLPSSQQSNMPRSLLKCSPFPHTKVSIQAPRHCPRHPVPCSHSHTSSSTLPLYSTSPPSEARVCAVWRIQWATSSKGRSLTPLLLIWGRRAETLQCGTTRRTTWRRSWRDSYLVGMIGTSRRYTFVGE